MTENHREGENHPLTIKAQYRRRIRRKRLLLFAEGPIESVLTAENIRTIYGVATEITETDGHLHVRLKKDLP